MVLEFLANICCFFLMFILNQEGGVLNEKQISDDDVKAMLKYNNIGNKYMKKDTEERERE